MNGEERLISISDRLKLWVETYGNRDNEACILISGAGANSSFWSESLCANLFSKNFYVIKYDHRDIGYSTKIDWDKNPYDFMQLAKDVLSILDALNIQKAHMIGHSMGGFIVQLLAIHFPEKLLSMSSISSSTNSPEVPLPPKETWEVFMANNPQNDLESDLIGFLHVWKYLNGTAEFDDRHAIEYTRNLYERQDILGAIGSSHVKAQSSLSDRSELLRDVKKPALIMHGEEDYLVDKHGAIQTAECIPNSKLVLIPQMGHIPFNKEIQKRFEDEIITFVSNNRA